MASLCLVAIYTLSVYCYQSVRRQCLKGVAGYVTYFAIEDGVGIHQLQFSIVGTLSLTRLVVGEDRALEVERFRPKCITFLRQLHILFHLQEQ